MAGTFLDRRKVKAATIDGVCADSCKEALEALAVSSNLSRVLKGIR